MGNRADLRATVLPWQAPLPLDQEHVLGDRQAWTDGGPPTTPSMRLSAN
ncbi:MAG: hypothetical protein ACK501_01955 [Planctomycetota bacterium]